MIRKATHWSVVVLVASACLLCLFLGCSKSGKTSPYTSAPEFEAAVTIAFQPYGIIGAQVRADSSLILLYTTGDFLQTYDANKATLQQLFRTWLDRLYDFRNKKEAVGIVVRRGQTDLMHASRDLKGKVVFSRT